VIIQPEAKSGSLVPILIGVIAALVILVVGGLVAFNQFFKKGQPEAPPAQVAVVPAPPTAPIPAAAPAVPAAVPQEAVPVPAPAPEPTPSAVAPQKVATRTPSEPVRPAAPARAPVEAGFGFLRINTSPWAKVIVDGEEKGTTPLAQPLKLPSGNHRVVLKNPDFLDSTLEVNIAKDKTEEKTATLNPLPKSFFKVTASPWADVYIDGQKMGTTPIASPIQVKAGQHEIKLVNPGCEEWVETINFGSAETVTKHFMLMPK
jgi:type IV secretory pathway VirB10-like protein